MKAAITRSLSARYCRLLALTLLLWFSTQGATNAFTPISQSRHPLISTFGFTAGDGGAKFEQNQTGTTVAVIHYPELKTITTSGLPLQKQGATYRERHGPSTSVWAPLI